MPGHVGPQKPVGKKLCSAGRLHPSSRGWERIRLLHLKHAGLAKYIHRALQIHPPGLRCCVGSGSASSLSRALDPHAAPAEQLAAIDQALEVGKVLNHLYSRLYGRFSCSPSPANVPKWAAEVEGNWGCVCGAVSWVGVLARGTVGLEHSVGSSAVASVAPWARGRCALAPW